MNGIATWASEDSVPTVSAVDFIFAFFAPNDIFTASTNEEIVARPSVNLVLKVASVDNVVAGTAVKLILSSLDTLGNKRCW